LLGLLLGTGSLLMLLVLIMASGCELLPTVRHGPRPAEVREQKW